MITKSQVIGLVRYKPLAYTDNHADHNYRVARIHPLNGDIMEGTGGIRKLRWASGGKGKSGGVRIIYYYHDPRIPLYLLTVFGKNEKSNITKSERNELAKLVKLLVHSALERKT